MNVNELIEAYLKLEAEADKDTGNEGDECFAMGKRDGFHDAVQLFDLATGGDGEFFGSTEPGGTVDVPVMAERIVERLAAAQARITELEASLREVIGMWPEHRHGPVKLPPMSVQREVFGRANEALTGEPR